MPIQPDDTEQSENCGPVLPGDSHFLLFLVCSLFPSLPCLLHFVILDVEKVIEIVESGDNPPSPHWYKMAAPEYPAAFVLGASDPNFCSFR